MDPLGQFDWRRLYQGYDAACKGFNGEADYLGAFEPRPRTDRELYRLLRARIDLDMKSQSSMSLGTYEGLLYWKLYSQPAAVANICRPIRQQGQLRQELVGRLRQLSDWLPGVLPPDSHVKQIVDLVRGIGDFGLHGMRSPTALPVRSTFRHLVFPEVVAIFDKMVLLSVGVQEKNGFIAMKRTWC